MFAGGVGARSPTDIPRRQPQRLADCDIRKPSVDVTIHYDVDAFNLARLNATFVVAGNQYVVVRKPNHERRRAMRRLAGWVESFRNLLAVRRSTDDDASPVDCPAQGDSGSIRRIRFDLTSKLNESSAVNSGL